MEQLKAKSQVAEKLQTPALNYLIRIYSILFLNALKRTGVKVQNIRGLLFLLVAPIYYALGLKVVKSPFGYFFASNRETLRSITYGFLKTYFYYIPNLKRLFPYSYYDTIVDVGANIGDFSLGMTHFGKKIFAIEPGISNYRELKANLSLNAIENIIPLNLAAHNKNEIVYLEGNTSDMRVNSRGSQLVEAVAIDDLAENREISIIDLLKIDVQGHEIAVLEGLSHFLQDKRVKAILIEVHEKRGVKPEVVELILSQFEYDLVYIDTFLFSQPHLYFVPAKDSKTQATKLVSDSIVVVA
jgi:FkbM family methyltransferase